MENDENLERVGYRVYLWLPTIKLILYYYIIIIFCSKKCASLLIKGDLIYIFALSN